MKSKRHSHLPKLKKPKTGYKQYMPHFENARPNWAAWVQRHIKDSHEIYAETFLNVPSGTDYRLDLPDEEPTVNMLNDDSEDALKKCLQKAQKNVKFENLQQQLTCIGELQIAVSPERDNMVRAGAIVERVIRKFEKKEKKRGNGKFKLHYHVFIPRWEGLSAARLDPNPAGSEIHQNAKGQKKSRQEQHAAVLIEELREGSALPLDLSYMDDLYPIGREIRIEIREKDKGQTELTQEQYKKLLIKIWRKFKKHHIKCGLTSAPKGSTPIAIELSGRRVIDAPTPFSFCFYGINDSNVSKQFNGFKISVEDSTQTFHYRPKRRRVKRKDIRRMQKERLAAQAETFEAETFQEIATDFESKSAEIPRIIKEIENEPFTVFEFLYYISEMKPNSVGQQQMVDLLRKACPINEKAKSHEELAEGVKQTVEMLCNASTPNVRQYLRQFGVDDVSLLVERNPRKMHEFLKEVAPYCEYGANYIDELSRYFNTNKCFIEPESTFSDGTCIAVDEPEDEEDNILVEEVVDESDSESEDELESMDEISIAVVSGTKKDPQGVNKGFMLVAVAADPPGGGKVDAWALGTTNVLSNLNATQLAKPSFFKRTLDSVEKNVDPGDVTFSHRLALHAEFDAVTSKYDISFTASDSIWVFAFDGKVLKPIMTEDGFSHTQLPISATLLALPAEIVEQFDAEFFRQMLQEVYSAYQDAYKTTEVPASVYLAAIKTMLAERGAKIPKELERLMLIAPLTNPNFELFKAFAQDPKRKSLRNKVLKRISKQDQKKYLNLMTIERVAYEVSSDDENDSLSADGSQASSDKESSSTDSSLDGTSDGGSNDKLVKFHIERPSADANFRYDLGLIRQAKKQLWRARFWHNWGFPLISTSTTTPVLITAGVVTALLLTGTHVLPWLIVGGGVASTAVAGGAGGVIALAVAVSLIVVAVSAFFLIRYLWNRHKGPTQIDYAQGCLELEDEFSFEDLNTSGRSSYGRMMGNSAEEGLNPRTESTEVGSSRDGEIEMKSSSSRQYIFPTLNLTLPANYKASLASNDKEETEEDFDTDAETSDSDLSSSSS